MNDRAGLIATASQTVGPFFQFGLTTDARAWLVADREPTKANSSRSRVRIVDGDARRCPTRWSRSGRSMPAGNAAAASPSVPRPARSAVSAGCRLRGWDVRVRDHPSGPGKRWAGWRFRRRTSTSVSLRAACSSQLHTRIYFNGDPEIEHDAVLARVPARSTPHPAGDARPAAAGTMGVRHASSRAGMRRCSSMCNRIR